ncbi:MAG TPA: hypothetical protein PK149_13670 [Flavobacteriales bacterium]|nr:hypothetical protein [Flavobacteriales bacterium]
MRTKSLLQGMVVAAATVLQLAACNAQDKPTGTTHQQDRTTLRVDTPEVDIKVNKQYDDQGNLIGFDSTYTSIYRGKVGDRAFMDSVFRDFQPGFRTRFPFLDDPGFNDLFFQDSLMHHDFFHDDFFRRRMELNERYMQRMMAHMDSVKNHVLNDQMQNNGKRDN